MEPPYVTFRWSMAMGLGRKTCHFQQGQTRKWLRYFNSKLDSHRNSWFTPKMLIFHSFVYVSQRVSPLSPWISQKKNLISSHRPHPKDSSSVMLFRHVLVNLPIYCQSMWNNSWLINIIWLIMALMVISVISQSCMAIRPNVDGLMGQIMLDPRFNTKFTTFSLLPTLQLRRGKPSHRNWSYHIVPGWWF